MKRLLALGTVVAVLAAGAIAWAGVFPGGYHGTFEGDPNTQIAFDIDRVDGVRKVRHLAFHVVFACYNGTDFRDNGFMQGGFPIHDGKFGGTRNWSNKGMNGEVAVAGRVAGAGLLKGTLRARGQSLEGTCYTGKLRWQATRDIL